MTQADLDTAIVDTSANASAVTEMGLTVSDPPTQMELQTVADKVDELIAALRRV